MLASIIHGSQLRYPGADEFYSPAECFPEYPFDHIAIRPNPVYAAVRACFAQAGLDKQSFGTPTWNPLGAFIRPGDKVFILCNFVYHRRPGESAEAFRGKCTHASVLRAVIDYVHLAAGPTGKISFGNAPLQSCIWEKVLKDAGVPALLAFYENRPVSVSARDLRLSIRHRGQLGQIVQSKDVADDAGIRVSLNEYSLLDELCSDRDKVRFRVSDYDPDRTDGFHAWRKHQYIINSEILSSQVVFSVPKLKTHEKVGITTGLKGYVGGVGHKDCLAHHRFGPPRLNGDEYPDNGRFQVLLSEFHDFVYRRRYPAFLARVLEILDKNSRRFARIVLRRTQSGAWGGNDTAWRMVVDLAHIMYYADIRGILCAAPQRRHIMLVDGIVGGEGDGPLSPSPVESRALFFSDNIAYGDSVAARLMGYDPASIPMLRYALHDGQLVDAPLAGEGECFLNGKAVRFAEIRPILGRPFVPPRGWRSRLT